MGADDDYKRLFEALADGVVVSDRATGRFLEVNPALAKLFGGTVEALRGQRVADFSSAPRETESVMKGEANPHVHREYRRLDGSTFVAEASVSTIEWSGKPAHVGVVRDVTERVRLEQALRDGRALLDQAFQKSPLLMAMSELETGRYVDVNETFCRMTGFTREELLGRTSLELGLIGADDRARMLEEMRGRGRASGLELAMPIRNGSAREMRIWVEIIQTSSGPRLFTTAEDITEFKRAERERNAVAARLEKIAQRVPGMVFQYRQRPDGSSSFPFTSDAIRGIYGITPADVMRDASLAWEHVHPEDRPGFAEAVARSVRDLTPIKHEYRSVLPDGTVKWVMATSIPEREADGSTIFHGFAADITERRELEAALAQNDRLASMGMLAAGVAHEINNPLAYVLSTLDSLNTDLPRLLEASRRLSSALRERLGEGVVQEVLGELSDVVDGSKREDVLACAGSALEGTRRIAQISRGLGTFSRVERAEAEPVDVNAALDAACTMAHNEVKFRATLVKELGSVSKVLGSEGKLAQVFLNLLINAAHAIPEGRVEQHRITVRSRQLDGAVEVEIADTGQGIAKEHLARVFEPFFTTKARTLGSGLGLAISRNIVVGFGGDIRIESDVGQGTRVFVKLPAEPKARPSSPPGASATSGTAGTRGRVLVIDDEPAIRRAIQRVLAKDNDVVVTGSGREAMTVLEQDTAFHVILCDLMMPDMTGMDLHAWLSQHAPAVAERLVFMSGGAFTPSAASYLQQVKNQRLEKPFDHSQLRALVAASVKAASTS